MPRQELEQRVLGGCEGDLDLTAPRAARGGVDAEVGDDQFRGAELRRASLQRAEARQSSSRANGFTR